MSQPYDNLKKLFDEYSVDETTILYNKYKYLYKIKIQKIDKACFYNN